MLGWLAPKCPLVTGEKRWVEFRMCWLAEKLGLERLTNAKVILPEPHFFPDRYDKKPEDALRIFERLCGYMKLDPGRFDLIVLPDHLIRNAVGLYERGNRPRIYLKYSQLEDPERLVATLAHELAHDILLGGGLITTREDDHEFLTDLLPVYLGLGIFAANATVRSRNHTDGQWHYFSINAQGYLSSSHFGYALALFAYARGETKPKWARYLRLDASQPFKHGLAYLTKTGDSLFHPATAGQPLTPLTEAEGIEQLNHGSATIRSHALFQIARLKPPPASLLKPVVNCLRHDDIEVRTEASVALIAFGDAAKVAVPDLLWSLTSDSPDLLEHTLNALVEIGAPPHQLIPELTHRLQDASPGVMKTAARGLGRFASLATSALPALVEVIRIKERDCGSSDTFADAVIAINPPPELLDRLISQVDPENRQEVARALRLARARHKRATDAQADSSA